MSTKPKEVITFRIEPAILKELQAMIANSEFPPSLGSVINKLLHEALDARNSQKELSVKPGKTYALKMKGDQ